MAANHDFYEFLRYTEGLLKAMRQRASDSSKLDAALVVGSREAIDSSRELLVRPTDERKPDR